MKSLLTIALLFSANLYTMDFFKRAKQEQVSLYDMVTTTTIKDLQRMHKIAKRQKNNNPCNCLPRIENFITRTVRMTRYYLNQ